MKDDRNPRALAALPDDALIDAVQRQTFRYFWDGADAASGFEAYGRAGFIGIFADGANHDQTNGKGGIDRFFSGRGFNEVGTGHHGDETGLGNVPQSQ